MTSHGSPPHTRARVTRRQPRAVRYAAMGAISSSLSSTQPRGASPAGHARTIGSSSKQYTAQ